VPGYARALKDPSRRLHATGLLSRVAATLSAVFTTGVLALVFLHGEATAIDGGTTSETGGRFAVAALLLAVLIPAFIVRFDVVVPTWIPVVSGLLSLLVVLGLWLLVFTGLDPIAWTAYGGLQVLRARTTFADLDWVARALQCNGCEQWPQLHGPALELLHEATGGVFSPEWVSPLGLFLAVLLSASLVYLSRNSEGTGRIALLIAAVSPAWLLLLERANLDGLVLLALVVGTWLALRYDSIASWAVLAGMVFVVGAIKYYPFAAAIVLIPVLRLRRGWMVIASFATAVLGYMILYWTDFRDASAYNTERNAVLWDFPAYGRLFILDRTGASVFGSHEWIVVNALVAGMAVAAVLWGWSLRSLLMRSSSNPAILALGGSTVFIAAIVVSGFGYMYKGGFLLLMVPLLSLAVANAQRLGSRFGLFSALFMLVLVLLALTVAYSSLLATISAVLSACFALGLAFGQVVTEVSKSRKAASDDQSTEMSGVI
jgi:hypothetical protein